MKQMYFTLTENEYGTMIGTICAFTDEDLTNKTKTAIEEHFDSEVIDIPKLVINDYISSGGSEFIATISNVDILTICAIKIQETWLY